MGCEMRGRPLKWGDALALGISASPTCHQPTLTLPPKTCITVIYRKPLFFSGECNLFDQCKIVVFPNPIVRGGRF